VGDETVPFCTWCPQLTRASRRQPVDEPRRRVLLRFAADVTTPNLFCIEHAIPAAKMI
jgi:hypothetical protein